jgi:hypothetical protein
LVFNFFDLELRFGLVRNVNDDSPIIQLVIPSVFLKFLNRYSPCIQTDLSILLNIKFNGVRHFYNEEVKELYNVSCSLLKNLQTKEFCSLVQEYREHYGLNEEHITEDNLIELALHLQHLCDVSLRGNKLLVACGGYDDSAFIAE